MCYDQLISHDQNWWWWFNRGFNSLYLLNIMDINKLTESACQQMSACSVWSAVLCCAKIKQTIRLYVAAELNVAGRRRAQAGFKSRSPE